MPDFVSSPTMCQGLYLHFNLVAHASSLSKSHLTLQLVGFVKFVTLSNWASRKRLSLQFLNYAKETCEGLLICFSLFQ